METTTSIANSNEAAVCINNPQREERLARLSPERRGLYGRISSRRERTGAVEHDIVASLKELRDNG